MIPWVRPPASEPATAAASVARRRSCGDNRSVLAPALAVVGASLDPAGPGAVALDGRAAHDGAVGQQQRLVLYRTIKACGEMFDRRPGRAVVPAPSTACRPGHWTGPELVIEPERSVLAVEKHRIVCGGVGLARQFERLRPLALRPARSPYGHVRLPLPGSAKPGREELVGPRFDDG